MLFSYFNLFFFYCPFVSVPYIQPTSQISFTFHPLRVKMLAIRRLMKGKKTCPTKVIFTHQLREKLILCVLEAEIIVFI